MCAPLKSFPYQHKEGKRNSNKLGLASYSKASTLSVVRVHYRQNKLLTNERYQFTFFRNSI